MQRVTVGETPLARYEQFADPVLLDEIRELGAHLRGHRVLHVSATAFGGGVAELLQTMVGLMADVGLDCEWHVLRGEGDYFDAAKTLHNALQGAPRSLTDGQWSAWERCNAINADILSDGWDTCVVHDPQPAALYALASKKAARWIWRCHIDLSAPHAGALSRLLPYIGRYPVSVFHLPAYVPNAVRDAAHMIAPAIDPLSVKNSPLPRWSVERSCARFGVDVDRPLICQVSRFDPWKDPLGVIDAYRIVREEVPNVQLVLAGSMANDDPEGWQLLRNTVEHADGDPDIHVLSNLDGVGPREINAFQRQAAVVLQKSIREGFGLTVSEALWKARPFVGGAVGGIPLQVREGESGHLVSSAEECAERVVGLLQDPDRARAMGEAGREQVRRHFLVPRLLRDWLRLLAGRSGDRPRELEEAVTGV